MRVNYAYGAYGDAENPHPRGEKIGDVDLEIFRLNADLDYNNIISRLEYRWYDGYSMIHTAWLGYNLGDLAQLKQVLCGSPSVRPPTVFLRAGFLTSIFMSGSPTTWT